MCPKNQGFAQKKTVNKILNSCTNMKKLNLFMTYAPLKMAKFVQNVKYNQ